MDVLVGKVVKRVSDALKNTVESTVAELKTTLMTMLVSASQFTTTATSYRDVLCDSLLSTVADAAMLNI